jgi:sterol desaturase/sphingolipid hydroxylase (fatty acid hydroxylase superfamily)
MLEQLRIARVADVAAFFLLANIVIFFGSIFLCWALGVCFQKKRIFDRWEPIRSIDLMSAIATVIINVVVSVIGWWLWTHDKIVLYSSDFIQTVADCVIMILAMDLGMYFLHRLAHFPRIYKSIHHFHHRHETTNPISLFVLHPLEVFGFGGLMILFLIIYPMSLGGLIGYLSLNVLFGTVGHSGVEPLPSAFRRLPVLRLIGTSTFHAEHHEHPLYNFGFYTLFWDQLFGTLDPDYDNRFNQKS